MRAPKVPPPQMPGRVRCSSPFCRRTWNVAREGPCREFICGPCGRRVPEVRKVYRRARKALELARLLADESGTYKSREDWARALRAERRFDRVWEAFKRRAGAAKLRSMGAGQ